MFELAVDVLDPGMSRFQLYLAIFVAMVAIFFTLLRTFLAERDAKGRKKVLTEMREYKEKARQGEVLKRQAEMRKWEEGEDWPVTPKDSEDDSDSTKKEKGSEKKQGGGTDGKK